MHTIKEHLELRILDIAPDEVTDLVSLAVGKIKDNKTQWMVTGGSGALFCYHPDTGEREIIDRDLNFGVGLCLKDIDGDGIEEIFTSVIHPDHSCIYMYKYNGEIWDKTLITNEIPGYPHDIAFGDIDNDGEEEIVTLSCYSSIPGIYIFKSSQHDSTPSNWKRYVVQEGITTEGTSLADINSDGKLEIICGPDWYEQPKEGALSGLWQRHTYAPSFREMCRTEVIDITGNGKPDIVLTDSEYVDGVLSWFENRLGEDGPDWVEHVISQNMVYSHSLQANIVDGNVQIFVAEMEQGGWDPPYNLDARILLYTSSDCGKTWTEREMYRGEGTHEAILESAGNGITVYGKTFGGTHKNPRVQIFSSKPKLNHLQFQHLFIDRDKQRPGTEITAFYPDGTQWIACASYVYKQRPEGWARFEIPRTSQVLYAYDIDGDGKDELIVTYSPDEDNNAQTFSNELYWKKCHIQDGVPKWEEAYIGKGHGDWPHGVVVAELLPNNAFALVTSYHSAHNGNPEHYPQIFSPKNGNLKEAWHCESIAPIVYGEELLVADITGNGCNDIVAGNYWLRNNGDGTFSPFTILENCPAARITVSDITGNGKPDVFIVEEKVDYETKVASFTRVLWCECPEKPETEAWKIHTIDSIRSPHSISSADLDGDGIAEILVSEHDPFWPYRSRNRTFIYKSFDKGKTWHRKTIDSRFEHHDGLKLIQLPNGKNGMISHGWNDTIYTHLWEIDVCSQ